MNIFIFIELNATQLSRLRQISGDDNLCFCTSHNDKIHVDPSFVDCTVAFGNVPAKWLENTTTLRWIQLETEHPLWRVPNTILTQHSGGGTNDEINRKVEFFAINLARYRATTSLINKVDIKRGY